MGNIHQINNYQILPIYHPGPISPKSHKANKQQVHNDELKNSIFKKANLLLMRCKTDEIPNESGIIKNLR